MSFLYLFIFINFSTFKDLNVPDKNIFYIFIYSFIIKILFYSVIWKKIWKLLAFILVNTQRVAETAHFIKFKCLGKNTKC